MRAAPAPARRIGGAGQAGMPSSRSWRRSGALRSLHGAAARRRRPPHHGPGQSGAQRSMARGLAVKPRRPLRQHLEARTD